MMKWLSSALDKVAELFLPQPNRYYGTVPTPKPKPATGLGLPWGDRSDEIIKKLNANTIAVLLLTKVLTQRGEIMAATTQQILAKVAAQNTKEKSIQALVAQMKASAVDANVTQQQLDAIFGGLTDNDAILDAINANTDDGSTGQATTTTVGS